MVNTSSLSLDGLFLESSNLSSPTNFQVSGEDMLETISKDNYSGVVDFMMLESV